MDAEANAALLSAARRIYVVGTSGSGKSTFARALANATGLRWIELDAFNHLPNWTERPPDEFRAQVETALDNAETEAGGWVADGNYMSRLGSLVLDRADAIVWLDFPKHLVMRRVIWRSVTRALFRTPLWNGNRETWRNLLSRDPHRSIVLWTWQQHDSYAQRYRSAATADGTRKWIVASSPKTADQLLPIR